MKYVIKSGELSAEVDSHGAELISVKLGEEERLWQNETGSWSGHAPVLFPVCGACGVTVNGKEYPIAKHGFARQANFAVAKFGKDYVRFTLVDNAQTRAVYPYAFRFEICYRAKDTAVEIEYKLHNPAQTPLYFSYGGHESFAVKGAYSIRFPQNEFLAALAHDSEGRLTGETKGYGFGKEITPREEDFEGGNTLIFSGISSRSVQLVQGDKVLAESQFPDICNLLLWKDKGDFICIEPWYNLPDSVGEHKEFCEKQTVKVGAGETFTASRRIVYYK